MKARVVELDAFTVMGLMDRFTDEEEQVGELWDRVVPYLGRIAVYSTDQRCYGVAIRTGAQGEWDYLAGMAVSKVVTGNGLEDLVALEIPPTRFVSVETTVETMEEAFAYINTQWLPASPYTRDPAGPTLDVYPPNTGSGAAPVLLYIPIQAAVL
jgi:AraC family transcriptional regulator